MEEFIGFIPITLCGKLSKLSVLITYISRQAFGLVVYSALPTKIMSPLLTGFISINSSCSLVYFIFSLSILPETSVIKNLLKLLSGRLASLYNVHTYLPLGRTFIECAISFFT